MSPYIEVDSYILLIEEALYTTTTNQPVILQRVIICFAGFISPENIIIYTKLFIK